MCGGGGGGGLAVYVESEYLFPIFFRATMDAELFIYFPRDPGHNIYFKVLTESTESTVRPLTKKGTSFNHSPIVPTAILNT